MKVSAEKWGEWRKVTGTLELPLGIVDIPPRALSGAVANKITIPLTTSRIGMEAFAVSKIKAIHIPEWMEVESGAFEHTAELEKATIENEIINSFQFRFCKNLKTVHMKDTVKINREAFAYSGLVTVDIPSTVTKIGVQAFAHCADLESIILPENLSVIDEGLFFSCKKLKKVTFSKSVKTIESLSFSKTGLEEIEIPDNVKSIKKNAFEDCEYLKRVKLPNAYTYMGEEVFRSCFSIKVMEMGEKFFLKQKDFSWLPTRLNNVIIAGVVLQKEGKEWIVDKKTLKGSCIENYADSIEAICKYGCLESILPAIRMYWKEAVSSMTGRKLI